MVTFWIADESNVAGNVNGVVAATWYNNGAAKLATTSTGFDITGSAVTDGRTGACNLEVASGTIKLDGNFPTGTSNVALGNNAGSVIEAGAQNNVLVGNDTGDAITTGDSNTLIGSGAGGDLSTSSHNVNIGHLAGAGSNEGSSIIIGSDAASASTGPGFGTVAIWLPVHEERSIKCL